MNTPNLEKKLIEIGYSNLFLSGDDEQLDSIWKDGVYQQNLEHIINSENSSLLVKFLAAEVLEHYDIKLPKEHNGELAKVYSYALENTSIENGNDVQLNGNLWGFLYEHNDLGYLGKKIVLLDTVAIPSLIQLLSKNGRILYEGSQEAMLGNSYQYRIKDFAAFYISKIKDIPIKFYQDIEKRDQEIERFKQRLDMN